MSRPRGRCDVLDEPFLRSLRMRIYRRGEHLQHRMVFHRLKACLTRVSAPRVSPPIDHRHHRRYCFVFATSGTASFDTKTVESRLEKPTAAQFFDAGSSSSYCKKTFPFQQAGSIAFFAV
jgi:hypothetical protein